MKISVVTTTRNDDHGGQQVARVNMFMGSLKRCADNAGAEVEHVLVEWNPPPDRQPLADVLEFVVPTTIITVPQTFHDRFPNQNVGPLFQMIAKNVGIGRAAHEWVLCTNPDLYFHPELFMELEPLLGKNKIYRAPRVDIQSTEVPTAATPAGIMSQLLSHEIKWNNRPWIDGLLTEACGDFQLCHIDHWRDLGGYCGWPIWSIHLDSLFAICAHHYGLQQVVLRWPVYHLEHHRSWVVNPEEQNERPHITMEDIVGWHNLMRKGGFAPDLNYPQGASFDFGDVDFETVKVGP